MYNDELTEQEISIDHLYLDPNNPRFWGPQPRRDIPDTRIMETNTQSRIEQRINRHGIEELQYSILRNGFLRIDRMVVREIKGHNDRYVVVEGNRRLAALRLLRQRISEGRISEEHISDDYLEQLYQETSNLVVLIYRGSNTNDISWILQGIRHIGGIRDWEPAQRAKLVADQVDEASVSFTEAGQKFGLSAHAVGRLYRSYNALQQMRKDDEYGRRVRNDYFSLFEEAYRNSNVRSILDWDEKSQTFKDKEHLSRFYAWITPDEEDEPANRRRIHHPKHVRCFGDLLGGDYRTLIARVSRHEIGIEAAADEAHLVGPHDTWSDQFLGCISTIKSLPSEVIMDNPSEYHCLVTKMILELTKFKSMAESLLEHLMKPIDLEKAFVYDALLPRVLSPGAPRTWNLMDEFRNHISSTGVGPIRSIEMAESRFSHLSEFLEIHLSYWDAQGIPRPLTQTDDDHIFLAWSHQQFLYYSGLNEAIDANFCELFLYLQGLRGKKFLIACALWLKCVGFSKIFVCDTAGDGGVDILGMLENGGLRSLVAVVQAKSSNQPISRALVLAEYGKYRMHLSTEQHIAYRRALGVDARVEGAAWSYMIFANQSFHPMARQASSRLGILLRSIHQLAFILANRYSRSDVECEVERLVDSVVADLTSNFCEQLSI